MHLDKDDANTTINRMYLTHSKVVTGYGRGRSMLGVPTGNTLATTTNLAQLISVANYPAQEARELLDALGKTGVYYGYCMVGNEGRQVFPMVASLGLNPFFKDPMPSFVRSSSFGRTT